MSAAERAILDAALVSCRAWGRYLANGHDRDSDHDKALCKTLIAADDNLMSLVRSMDEASP